MKNRIVIVVGLLVLIVAIASCILSGTQRENAPQQSALAQSVSLKVEIKDIKPMTYAMPKLYCEFDPLVGLSFWIGEDVGCEVTVTITEESEVTVTEVSQDPPVATPEPAKTPEPEPTKTCKNPNQFKDGSVDCNAGGGND